MKPETKARLKEALTIREPAETELTRNIGEGFMREWNKDGPNPAKAYLDLAIATGRIGELLDWACDNERMGHLIYVANNEQIDVFKNLTRE